MQGFRRIIFQFFSRKEKVFIPSFLLFTMSKARIKLVSTNVEQLNTICSSIKDISVKAGVAMRGPIPLPNNHLKITTRKSPCGDGKASFDRFEMRVHKRLIDLGVDERALRLIMRVPLPKGVNIEINLLER